jgi:hypothetical protein
MREVIEKYRCDECGKETKSPHIVIQSFDRSNTGWAKKLPDEEYKEWLKHNQSDTRGHRWRVVARLRGSGTIHFCNERCLAKYFRKALDDYKINKLKE